MSRISRLDMCGRLASEFASGFVKAFAGLGERGTWIPRDGSTGLRSFLAACRRHFGAVFDTVTVAPS